MITVRAVLGCLIVLSTVPVCHAADPESKPGTLLIAVLDLDGASLPCRIHLSDSEGKPQRAPGLPFWRDHFVCPGEVTLSLPEGLYRYELERGPEFDRESGEIEITGGVDHSMAVTLRRIAHLRDQGWYSGDLHVHRPIGEIELLMQAEDLDFAPVITWWNGRNVWADSLVPDQIVKQFDGHRIATLMAGEDEREGGALLYFGLETPLDLTGNQREVPSPMVFVEQARRRNPGVWIDIEKPFWWDVPLWLASGKMNSIGIANNHQCRSRMLENEAWGRPRDVERLPNPRGNGFWTQEIYYHILNSGLRIPPSAGSASGVLPNPVGYNRVYVHLNEPFTRDSWFQGLTAGRCFATNGPLLLVRADGELPGAVFRNPAGETLTLEISIELTSNDPVSSLEIIQNGEIVQKIACESDRTQRLETTLETDSSGWFLIRAIADIGHTFRFATTGPFYVEDESKAPRISRRSAQFFLDWVDERIERVRANVTNNTQRADVLQWHTQARTFWEERLKTANAE